MRVIKRGLIAVFSFPIILVLLVFLIKKSVFLFNFHTKEDPINMLERASNLLSELIQSRAESDQFQKTTTEVKHSPLPPIVEDGFRLIDRRVAEEVSKKVRVFCWIPTREMYRETRLRAVNSTWVRRCDKIIYIMTTSKVKSHDTIVVSIPDHRKTLNDKTVFTLRYIYEHFLNDFDWFLKADDNTYVIMENLRFMLSQFDTKVPGYIGCQFRHFSPEGYLNGGAGYAFNSLGIKTIVEQGYNIPGRCRLTGGAEDIETGRCANKAGVRTLSQLDVNGKNTFFSSSVDAFVVGPLPWWVHWSSLSKPSTGLDCCSPLVVSFHHTDEKLMFQMEYLLYKVVVHGRSEILSEASALFSGKEAEKIPQSVKRRAYVGEKLEDYYAPGWRERNTTVLHNPWKPGMTGRNIVRRH